MWKQKINDNKKNAVKNYAIQEDYHLIKNTRVIVLDKPTAREIHSVLL